MALGDYALTPCGLLFHPHTSLWGKELPVRASAPRRGWGRREVKRHPNRSPFSRSVWLSLSITAVFVSFYREQLLAAGDRRRDEKAIFIKQNYPSKRVRWMWLAWSRSGPPGRSEERWRSMPLIGSMGWLKAQKRGERGDRSHHQLWWGVWGWGGGVSWQTCFCLLISPLIPRYPHGTAEADAASKGSALSLMSH